MDEELRAYLLAQRDRMRSRIGVLRSGRCWTSETLDGQTIDTTAETLSALEDNLEEIERLLEQV